MGSRAEALASRIEQGATALASFARTLSDKDWQTRVPRDGRTVGVIVHHVADVYPLEIQLAQLLGDGKPIGATWNDVHQMNAKHSEDNANVKKEEAIAHLEKNSRAAAAAVRKLSDSQLDNAAAVGLNFNAPLTCQFFIEDHALRHSFHHLARIKEALGR